MTTPLMLTANDLTSGGMLDFVFGSQRRSKRTFTTGELLNDQTAGSAADVQKQANAQFVSKVESRDSRVSRRAAETSVENSRVDNANFGSRQLASFQIPTSIRA